MEFSIVPDILQVDDIYAVLLLRATFQDSLQAVSRIHRLLKNSINFVGINVILQAWG